MKNLKLLLFFGVGLLINATHAGTKIDTAKRTAVRVKDGVVKVAKVGGYVALIVSGYNLLEFGCFKKRVLSSDKGETPVGSFRNGFLSVLGLGAGIIGLYHELGIEKLVDNALRRIKRAEQKQGGSNDEM